MGLNFAYQNCLMLMDCKVASDEKWKYFCGGLYSAEICEERTMICKKNEQGVLLFGTAPVMHMDEMG